MCLVSAFLAIIPPRAEVDWYADSVVCREGPIHVAAMIGLVTLFVIAWMLLSEGSPRTRT